MKSSTNRGEQNKLKFVIDKNSGSYDINTSVKSVENENVNKNDDNDSDVISKLIGHYGVWQFFWTFLLCLFQFPCTFHIFALVFQVSYYDL